MTTEEKAKRYDEAINIAKNIHRFSSDPAEIKRMEQIFPELAESEDESIRKEIISALKFANVKGVYNKHIAWIERQAEQNPTDMSIKEKAHQIAWETSKHYDPLLSKECWCEMAALDMASWLEKQGEPVEINPTEFDTRLQALIGKFGSLPKEELIGSLSFWMNVVQNDGTYKPVEKQGEQKSAWSEEDENELAILRGYIRSGEWSTAHINRALGIIDSIINKMTEK